MLTFTLAGTMNGRSLYEVSDETFTLVFNENCGIEYCGLIERYGDGATNWDFLLVDRLNDDDSQEELGILHRMFMLDSGKPVSFYEVRVQFAEFLDKLNKEDNSVMDQVLVVNEDRQEKSDKMVMDFLDDM